MTELCFHEWVFDPDLLMAKTPNGTLVRFTRQERALLQAFIHSRSQLLEREALLEVLADSASDMSQRNVDFIVNRLRRKLRDRARDPRFIATQYGEGYVWVAERTPIPSRTPYLVVGPIHCLDATPRVVTRLQGLVSALSAQLPMGLMVVMADHGKWDEGQMRPAFSVEVYSVSRKGQWQITAVIHDAARGRLLTAEKFVLDKLEDEVSAWLPIASRLLRATAQSLVAKPDDLQVPKDQPLYLQLHDAGMLLSRSSDSWLQSEKIVEERSRTYPNDVHNTLLLACTRMARLILSWGADGTMDGHLEDEVESMVFAVLPQVEDSPNHMLVAAKLLIGCGRGYLPLAERLAEAAMEQLPAWAAGLSLLGEVRMYQGKVEKALRYFDQALSLSVPRSEFRVYLLVLKLAALIAGGDRETARNVEAELYEQKPITRAQLGLYLAPPNQPLAPDLTQMIEHAGAKGCEAAILHLHLVSARHFLEERCRQNLMQGISWHAVHRFGRAVLPAAVLASVPNILDQCPEPWRN